MMAMRMPAAALSVALLFAAPAASLGCGGASTGGAPPSTASEAAGPLAQLAFMSGDWVTEDGATEEHWLAPRGETMIGVARAVKGGRTVLYEFLRIAVEGGTPVLFASPNGKSPPIPFRLVESSTSKAVFANPEHDDPKRITYEREGDGLRATTEGASIDSFRMRRRR